MRPISYVVRNDSVKGCLDMIVAATTTQTGKL